MRTLVLFCLSVMVVNAADVTINDLSTNSSPSAATIIEVYDPSASPKSGKVGLNSFTAFSRVEHLQSLTWSATNVLDAAESIYNYRTLTLEGDSTFTTTNAAAGHWMTVIITGAATNCSVTFPAWKFQSQVAPTTVAGGKTSVLTVFFVDNTDTNAIANYSYQP